MGNGILLSLNKWRLRLTLERLAKRGFAHEHVELVPCPGGFFASMGARDADKIISEDVVTGFSSDPHVAFLKVVSEAVEREAYRRGKAGKNVLCMTNRSDGLAAFPTTLRSNASARSEARLRAYGEACERFVWASWWDNVSVGAVISPAEEVSRPFQTVRTLLEGLPTPYRVRSINVLFPYAATRQRLVIFVCEMENGGFLSGGACGLPGQEEETFTRAAAELFRHALAAKRLVEMKAEPSGFYQERLSFFALGSGGSIVKRRLSSRGEEKVVLPPLAMDDEIPHAYSDVVCVYRCLFENQPPFVGGAMERFCL